MGTFADSLRIARFAAFPVVLLGATVFAQTPPTPAAPTVLPALPDPNAVVPGELFIEPPTLINLGFEWLIQGDDNRNASVAVSFRKQGASEWRAALPLLRLHGERIYSESRIDVVAPNMFAGQHSRSSSPTPRTKRGS